MIVLDSWPITAASKVELIPRAIIRETNACRIEWNATPSILILAADKERGAVTLSGRG